MLPYLTVLTKKVACHCITRWPIVLLSYRYLSMLQRFLDGFYQRIFVCLQYPSSNSSQHSSRSGGSQAQVNNSVWFLIFYYFFLLKWVNVIVLINFSYSHRAAGHVLQVSQAVGMAAIVHRANQKFLRISAT